MDISFSQGDGVRVKCQSAIMPMVSGVALMIYPYFVSSVILLVIMGVVLMALPYFLNY